MSSIYGPGAGVVDSKGANDQEMADAEAKHKPSEDAPMGENSSAAAQHKDGPASRIERPLRRELVRTIINETLRQQASDFGDVKVVHDGVAALYAPALLPFGQSIEYAEMYPDGITPPPTKGRAPMTCKVKIKLVEAIELHQSYTDPEMNPLKAFQALDATARHLGSQR